MTGGAGYLGSVLVPKLLEAGHKVRVVDCLLYGGEGLLGVYAHPGFEFLRGDIRQGESIRLALTQVDAVVHLAALVGDAQCERAPDVAHEVNVGATKSLIKASQEASVNRFILVSTCSCYGISDPERFADEDSPINPVSLYGKTKMAAEAYVLKNSEEDGGPSKCVLRLATLFGLSPRMRFDLLVNEFAKDAMVKGRLLVYGPNSWRPFLHVLDAAELILRCLELPCEWLAGKIYNAGVGNYRKIELAELLKNHIPRLKVEVAETKRDPRDYKVDFGKMEKILGFKPQRSLEQGIAELLEAIQSGIIPDPNDPRYYNAPLV